MVGEKIDSINEQEGIKFRERKEKKLGREDVRGGFEEEEGRKTTTNP